MMIIGKYIAINLLVVCAGCVFLFAQTKADSVRTIADYKGSPAFAELRLRRADLESDLEANLLEYTDDFPKVKEIRVSLKLLQKESDRLANVTGGTQRLTLALGKLMVRKVELEADLMRLLETLQPAHPDVKRAKKKVEIYEAAIKEILG